MWDALSVRRASGPVIPRRQVKGAAQEVKGKVENAWGNVKDAARDAKDKAEVRHEQNKEIKREEDVAKKM